MVQSCGHIFPDGKPYDLHYKESVSKVTNEAQPLCPCTNSAFVPWSALQEIAVIDHNYFDLLFKRMTCFDLGLKLRLLGYGCELIPTARATHSGYLQENDIGEKRVLEELRSRLLLYKKFLPYEEHQNAMRTLQKRIECQKKNYPRSTISGKRLRLLFDNVSQYVAGIKTNPRWKELAEALPQGLRRDFFV